MKDWIEKKLAKNGHQPTQTVGAPLQNSRPNHHGRWQHLSSTYRTQNSDFTQAHLPQLFEHRLSFGLSLE
jgi:hypothetical protein